MNLRLSILTLSTLLAFTGAAGAETLLMERTQQEVAGSIPARGLSASEVEARFGTPRQKLEPRGGQKRQWPVINRWVYPAFTVYFEKNRVIDVVAIQADADEIGPKPPIR